MSQLDFVDGTGVCQGNKVMKSNLLSKLSTNLDAGINITLIPGPSFNCNM